MFERGSEWRRWDLHVHTPQTKKNDQYEGCNVEEKWEKFYAHIRDYIGDGTDVRKHISVIGITDYLSIDNYLKVVEDDCLPSSVGCVLPNVEMRIMPTGTDSPVNIHFIFNPEIVSELEDRFFSKIKFDIGERVVSASRNDLISLGKKYGTDLSDKDAYQKGIERFVPTYASIHEVFKNDSQLRENTIIGVANSSTDGASGINRGNDGDQLSEVRDAVYKLCDFIFSSNEGDINYFLGKKVDRPELVIQKYGSIKPCIHGSDAHQLEKLFEPANERYCWVKADPSFNGLLQVIYEPEARVRISSFKPEEKSDYQVIDCVEMRDEDMGSSPILLNDKLTCIIGGKSTGKSLLLQNMARAIDKRQVEEKLETSNATTKVISDVSVVWRDGTRSSSGEVDNTHKIVYIPQTYLNRLTDHKEESTEIDRIIQEIVLLDAASKEAFEQMDKLIKQFKPHLDKKIYDLIDCYAQMNEILNRRAEIGTEEGIKKEIEKYQKQKEIISQKLSISEDDVEKYDNAVKKIAEISELISGLSSDLQALESMKTVMETIELGMPLSIETREQIESFQAEMLGQIAELWENKKKEIREALSIRKQELEKQLQENIELREQLGVRIHENETLSRLSDLIRDEFDKLRRVEVLTSQYHESRSKYDELLVGLAETFEFYKSTHSSFADAVNQNAQINSDGLEFSVIVPLRMEALCSSVRMNINNISLKKSQLSFDEDMSEEFLTKDAIKGFIQDIVEGKVKLLKNKTAESVLREFLQDWYNVTYDVQMDNDGINQMSPGKKALVLLKLLISMAESKCPILIDQPEDDLDNRSIFEELIPFIREKKISRQIIIVTHNANVVLGGDAEEVIVANQSGNNTPNNEKRFEYRTGAIENDKKEYHSDGRVKEGILSSQGIQQHICDILEGGEKAFDLRRSKYRI